MKSLVKFINESTSLSEYYVRFVKVDGDPGIMFEGEDGEYEPEDVKAICDAVGLEYYEDRYDKIDVPVYFWNIKKNTCYYVSRGKCKDLI